MAPERGWAHFVTDHPKTAGVVAMIALAVAFSGKLDTYAVWFCLLIAYLFCFLEIPQVPKIRDSRKPLLWKTVFRIFSFILVGGFGYWLTAAKAKAPETQARPNQAPVADVFAHIYEVYKGQLGNAKSAPENNAHPDGRYGAYEASFLTGRILWTHQTQYQYVLQNDSTFSRYPDRGPSSLWFSESFLRKKLGNRYRDPKVLPPLGGTAIWLVEHPSEAEKLGAMEWHCYLRGELVWQQHFEHGMIMGPFRERSSVDNSGLILVLVYGDDENSGKYYQETGVIDAPPCDLARLSP